MSPRTPALLAAADRRLGVTAALVEALVDWRQAAKVDHAAAENVQAQVYAIAQGYEDGHDLDWVARRVGAGGWSGAGRGLVSSAQAR